jgi:hypothetical protein
MVDHCARLQGHCPLCRMTNVCISEGDSGKPSALRDDDAAKLQPGSENGRASARVRGAAQIEDVLSDVTTAAKELIPDADTAGLLLVGKGGKFELSIRRSGGPSRFRYREWGTAARDRGPNDPTGGRGTGGI